MEPCDNSFLEIEQKAEEPGYMAGIVWLCGRRSTDIWQEERGYMARGSWLYDAMILMATRLVADARTALRPNIARLLR